MACMGTPKPWFHIRTTCSNGCLESHNNDEHSEMKNITLIAELYESSKALNHQKLVHALYVRDMLLEILLGVTRYTRKEVTREMRWSVSTQIFVFFYLTLLSLKVFLHHKIKYGPRPEGVSTKSKNRQEKSAIDLNFWKFLAQVALKGCFAPWYKQGHQP